MDIKEFFEKNKLIGCCGNARSGKNSLQNILCDLAKEQNFKTHKLALAKVLKNEIQKSFKLTKVNLNAFTEVNSIKEIIRPILVEWGRMRRKLSKGTYFTSKLDKYLKYDKDIKIISDIRYYNEYPEDEFFWLKRNGGVLIYLSRILPSGEKIQPANEDEAKNNILLRENADFGLEWQTDADLTTLRGVVEEFIKKI